MGGGAMTPMQTGQGQHNPMGMSLGHGNLLTGSGFALNRATSSGGILSFWSRSAESRFHGREGVLSLNGDVRTTMFGADYAKGGMVTALSLSHSRGLGNYAGVDTGRVTSAVTGIYPWIGYKANERVTVWTVTGYGASGLLLEPGNAPAMETGMAMAMAAGGGGRGQIVGGGDGFGLAFKADAVWVGTRTDESNGPGGRLNGTKRGEQSPENSARELAEDEHRQAHSSSRRASKSGSGKTVVTPRLEAVWTWAPVSSSQTRAPGWPSTSEYEPCSCTRPKGSANGACRSRSATTRRRERRWD